MWTIQILIPNGSIPTFVWEPQEANSSAPQNFDQCCVLSIKSYPENFRGIYQEITEHRIKSLLKNPNFCMVAYRRF
jgi:hypothetical protein